MANLHEYQAKNILKKYDIPIPNFRVATNQQEVKEALRQMQITEAVLKIQIHAGGRKKAGGVLICNTEKEILKGAETLLGMKVVNSQTGPGGLIANQILVTEKIEIKKEYYLSILIDRKIAKAVIIASKGGGTEIEEIAKKDPTQIFKMAIPTSGKLKHYHLLNLINYFEWDNSLAEEGKSLINKLVTVFFKQDASLLEINPLVLTQEGFQVLDTKLSIDDNALFRHPEIEKEIDLSQVSLQEALAKKENLAYIALQGNIGCMVNGAGLAMATMDLIKRHGGEPANFLDVGGGASQEKIAYGFKIILQDPKVKVIFINIFGGIMNCATLAKAIVSALEKQPIAIPLIVRLEGNQSAEGKKILKESQKPINAVDSMEQGAKKAVEYLKE